MRIKKVIVLYRVVQHWRAPFFDLLNKDSDIELAVWHGPNFKNSKLTSTKSSFSFKTQRLFSLKLKFKSKNGDALMPFSPFLFFKLVLNNPDVVIAEGASNIANSIQGFIYSKLFRKKFIWWSLGKIKNRDYDKKRSKIDRLVQYIERNSSSIISYSTRGKEYFKSIGAKEENIFVAVNVVDTNKIISKDYDNRRINEKYNSPYKFTVIFVGALIKEKNIDSLLHAFSHIQTKDKDIGLLVVGDGTYRSNLEELAKTLKLSSVQFLGKRITDSYKFFNCANLFVLPGLGGLAISEAMSYGLPIICSVGDGCEVDLVNNENGIIEENPTSENLAKHILWFKENNKLTNKMGENSLKLIIEKYNTENYIKNIKNAIYN